MCRTGDLAIRCSARSSSIRREHWCTSSARDRDNDHRWPASGPPYPPSALVLSWAMVLSEATVAGAAGTRLHLRLRVNRIGHHAPALAASLAGLMDEATVRPMFAGLSERVR